MSYGNKSEQKGNRTPDLGPLRARALPLSYLFNIRHQRAAVCATADLRVERTREDSRASPADNVPMTNWSDASFNPARPVAHGYGNVAEPHAAETPSDRREFCGWTE